MSIKEIIIERYPITLGQFLKYSAIVSDGMEARDIIASGTVAINGEIDTRRGRKLFPGDTVTVDTDQYQCSRSGAFVERTGSRTRCESDG
ncbi:MAG: RNA-binding protein [Proteobacteria bacterium]|nr:MAG: RNA-binding protein [Pseudomonadota bacterium]